MNGNGNLISDKSAFKYLYREDEHCKEYTTSPEEIIPVEVYKKWEHDYYVNELPKNPKPGQLVCYKGVEYVFMDSWKSLQPAEEKILMISEILNNNGTIEEIKEVLYPCK